MQTSIAYNCHDRVLHEGAWLCKKTVHVNVSHALVTIEGNDSTIKCVSFATTLRFFDNTCTLEHCFLSTVKNSVTSGYWVLQRPSRLTGKKGVHVLEANYNRPFARSGHGTKSHMLVRKLRSGASRTKAGPGGLVRAALFWKFHCATCTTA